jgi:MFS family permease
MATSALGGASPVAETDERWVTTDTWLFVSFALGFTLESYIFTLAPIATGWVHEPASLRSLLLAWAPIWLIVGIAVAGPLADRLGRKDTFYLTMALYGLGAIGLIFSNTYVLVLVFLAVLLFAAGGEMNTIMAATHEVMPTRHRSKATMLALNFINFGGLVVAVVDIAVTAANSSVSFQRGMIAVTILVILFVLLLARSKTPESVRWLEKRGRSADARAEIARYYGEAEWAARARHAAAATSRSLAEPGRHRPSIGLRLFVTITTAFAGTAGFGLLVYTLGPVHYPHRTADIILIAELVGFVSGIFALWADRLSRKLLLFVGYFGAAILTLVIFLTYGSWVGNFSIFLLMLVVLSIFVNISYLTEDTLKAEVWATEQRSTWTAVVRFVSIGAYIGTIYLTEHYSTQGLIAFNLVVWIIGLAGAVVWLFAGSETGKGASVEYASGETGLP